MKYHFENLYKCKKKRKTGTSLAHKNLVITNHVKDDGCS